MVEIGKDIYKASDFLFLDDVVAIPTETVYGLAANALSEIAVNKVFSVKGRPKFNPLIVHISGAEVLHLYVKQIPDVAKLLIKHFWPGPMTLLLPKKPIISDLITAGLPNVAIRVPNHVLTLELINNLPFPIVAPSANPFGYISPTSAEHVAKQLGETIPYILDGGSCSKGLESTVIGFEEDIPVIYRLGTITAEEINAVCGKLKIAEKESQTIKGPGMLKQHYSPYTQFIISDNIEKTILNYNPSEIGIITLSKKLDSIPCENQFVLSEKRDLAEAAQNLYRALHHLDNLQLKVIITEPMPDENLGRTINDRINRAAAKFYE